MIKIYVSNEPGYPVNTTHLKQQLKRFLLQKGKNYVEIEVALVDVNEIKRLGKTYLKEEGKGPHNVLSFVDDETKNKFIFPTNNIKRLGEVVVCYPKALEEAKHEGKRTEKKVYELAEHGVRHLLGEHHEE